MPMKVTVITVTVQIEVEVEDGDGPPITDRPTLVPMLEQPTDRAWLKVDRLLQEKLGMGSTDCAKIGILSWSVENAHEWGTD